jgi:hypothetical protein
MTSLTFSVLAIKRQKKGDPVSDHLISKFSFNQFILN